MWAHKKANWHGTSTTCGITKGQEERIEDDDDKGRRKRQAEGRKGTYRNQWG